VRGLKVGEEKKETVPPEDAFGKSLGPAVTVPHLISIDSGGGGGMGWGVGSVQYLTPQNIICRGR